MNTTIKTLSAKQILSKEDKSKIKLYMKIDKIMNPKYYLLLLCLLLLSCNNKENERITYTPMFKLVSFGKIESLCTATIKVEGLHGRFSIDGLIKENEINSFQIIAPKGREINYSITRKYDDVNLINIYGNYAENITIKISWICTENHNNYLVGWHLDYGFGDNCEVLMINLEIK